MVREAADIFSCWMQQLTYNFTEGVHISAGGRGLSASINSWVINSRVSPLSRWCLPRRCRSRFFKGAAGPRTIPSWWRRPRRETEPVLTRPVPGISGLTRTTRQLPPAAGGYVQLHVGARLSLDFCEMGIMIVLN